MWLVVCIDINWYILTEGGRNFKKILKDNYAVALDSCYLFTTKMLNMELNMILIVLMKTLDIPEIYSTANLMNTLQFKLMMNLTVC